MGIMPFHLEKGVMGLRFDFLMRSPEVRQFILGSPDPDPFHLAANINVGGIQIDALHDDLNTFKDALDQLYSLNNYQFDSHERRQGREYLDDNRALDQRNNDMPGNRRAFVDYWTNAAASNPGLTNVMRIAMRSALQSVTLGLPRPRIDHWWDCTLPDGNPPTVIYSDQVPSIARVLFCTPHTGVVESIVRGQLPPRP
jgi:hypothetical protein